jgi:hypothetical protein
MSNYVVAIPSYNRADVITPKTLNTLKRGKIEPYRIYIFVANKTQRDLYESQVPKELYREIVIGKKGITNQRKFISAYFPENQYIISIDDDVEEVLKLKGTDQLTKVHNLDTLFHKAYELLKKNGLFLWGIYPVRNAFFMKPTITTDLRFIIGVLHGYINRHLRCLRPSNSSETKEDYEQSILFYRKDGGVLRFNNLTTKTKFHSEGGLGTDRFERNKLAADYLQKTYPHIVTIFQRDNGMTEVKLSKNEK